MLVTFSSSATSDLVMFSDVARRLLELLGKSPTARGVLTPDEFSEALYRLQHVPPETALSEQPASAPSALTGPDSEAPDRIGLDVRAYPLANMIRQADGEKVSILWLAPADFFAATDGPAVN